MGKLASEHLTEALALIRNPENWCQVACAQTADGTKCSPWDKKAVRYCAMGAVQATFPVNSHHSVAGEVVRHLNLITRLRFYHPIHALDDFIRYNDANGRKHAEVVKLFEDAIEHAKTIEAFEGPTEWQPKQ